MAKGFLCQGDEVTLVLGDTSGGGPGIRAQTFPESRHTFKIVVDTFNRKHFYELEHDPEIRVVGGAPETWHLALSANTKCSGEEFSAIVRGVDSWGNPAEEFTGEVSVRKSLSNWSEEDAAPGRVEFSRDDGGAKRVGGARLTGEGPYRLRLEDPAGLISLSPPILPKAPDDPYSLFWGDIHGQTRSTVGTGTVEEYFRFARDKAGVDIAAWQGNDFRVRKEDWAEVVRECKAFNEPGRFVTLLGYEWSGTRAGGGDYNIYYAGDEGTIHRSSHAGVDDLSDVADDRFPISALWETFRGREDVMSVAHVGGRACNLDFFDPEFVHLRGNTLPPRRLRVVRRRSARARFQGRLHRRERRSYGPPGAGLPEPPLEQRRHLRRQRRLDGSLCGENSRARPSGRRCARGEPTPPTGSAFI